MKKKFFLLYRYGIFFFFIFRCLFWVLVFFPFKKTEEKFAILRVWIFRFFKYTNIHIEIEGETNFKHLGWLFVANHISYFDPIILLTIDNFRFIASDHIQLWPLIGRIIQEFDLILIKRDKAETNEKVAQVTNILKHKKNVILFPEGTTSIPNQIRSFKKSYFQAAIDAKSSVVPVIIRYLNPNQTVNHAFNFTHDRHFFKVITDIFNSPKIIVKIIFLNPINAAFLNDRTLLANDTYEKMVKIFHQWS